MQSSNPDSSSGRTALLAVLVVAALIIVTVHFREGDTGPVHTLRAAVQSVATPFETAGEFVTRPLRSVGTWFSNMGVSREEVATLRRQNSELRKRNAELEEARQENERLRALVKFVEARDLEALGARVIGRAPNSWEGVITIDRGTADGVEAGMPVIGDAGLLGQTVEVTPNSAKVRLITDQSSGVAALVQSTRVEGIARGSIDRQLTLDFVSNEATVRAGDVVLTSGIGGVYPKGLVIGEVTSVRRQPNALAPSITLRPSARLGDMEEVLVLIGTPPSANLRGGE
jgi:rod shape-determining protein MreC